VRPLVRHRSFISAVRRRGGACRPTTEMLYGAEFAGIITGATGLEPAIVTPSRFAAFLVVNQEILAGELPLRGVTRPAIIPSEARRAALMR
jgi:hypothetical protein